MVHHLWLIYALLASVMWGAGYALSEKILHNGVSGYFLVAVYALISAPFFLCASYATKTFKPSLDIVLHNKTFLFYLVALALCYIVGNLFVFKSIAFKNATHTSLVEITYPLFVVLFSWLFFKDVHLNPAVILGACLIFCGVGLIYWKS